MIPQKNESINELSKDVRFLAALEQGLPMWKAAIATGEVGKRLRSRGEEISDEKMQIMASQWAWKRMKRLAPDILTAMEKIGVTPLKVAQKVKILLDATTHFVIHKKNGKTTIKNIPDYTSIDKGITQALKAGLGGGYKREELPAGRGMIIWDNERKKYE